MNKRTTLAIFVTVFALLLSTVGIGYAWFSARVETISESSNSVITKAANLGTIIFSNGNVIRIDDVNPGWCETKRVSIETENATVNSGYKINLTVVRNELAELGEDLGYITVEDTVVTSLTTLTSGSIGHTGKQDITITSGNMQILSGVIAPNETHTYDIEFCFPELYKNQNSQQNKRFNGKLSVESTISTVENYTIAYNLNGGTETIPNPTSYTSETNTITLSNPTREGYEFMGWTGSNDLSSGLDMYTIENPYTASVRDHYFGNEFDVVPGETYRVFVTAKRTAGSLPMQGGIRYTRQTSGNSYDGHAGAFTKIEDLIDGWAVYYKDVIVPSEKSKGKFYIQLPQSSPDFTTTWQLADMHVVKLSGKSSIATGSIGNKNYIANWREKSRFEKDSWATIVSNVQNGNIDSYNVGDTKLVNMGDLGIHTLRISNKGDDDPVDCTTNENYSQTACGFVVEFADIITTHAMRTDRYTNVGSWPALTTDSGAIDGMREYLNTTIYNLLPLELKNGIIDTRVISGHGPTTGETNFASIDKLYLLSVVEIYGTYEPYQEYDTLTPAYTRQLEYYENMKSCIGCTTKNSNLLYWLRTPDTSKSYRFLTITASGGIGSNGPSDLRGVSPAFRIG